MTYDEPILSIAILDFKRAKEAELLLLTLKDFLLVPAKIVYCHDGPPDQYVLDLYKAGRIDTLIYTKKNEGCGIQTRQLFQACMTPYILYCQVDQYLNRPFGRAAFEKCVETLKQPGIFYVDLAGNQGQGRPSERALLMERRKYLDIPDIDTIIGGPGPYADHKWTEKHLQDYMVANGLRFITFSPTLFGDNGKWSRRVYPCGGETLHATDEKTLLITKPLLKRYDAFPNLKLTDSEWADVLNGHWPSEGRVPEQDKPHSFKVW